MPKVIDFGIAKATEGSLTDRTAVHVVPPVRWAPRQYMSPEQADSNGVDVDTRTDVYSLGVLTYELLVGTTPLDARSLRSAAFEAMRRMIREDEPARPSTRLSSLGPTLAAVATNRGTDAKQLGRQLHGELDWIVMKALEKDRGRRYETAAAMADDLGRHLAGEVVLAGPVSGTYRLRKLARRHRAAIAIAGTIAAVLLLGVIGTTTGLLGEARARRLADAREQEAAAGRAAAVAGRAEAVAERRVADARAAEARAVVAFLTDDVLGRASPKATGSAAASRLLVDALLRPAAAHAAVRFAGQPLVRASVQQALAEVLHTVNRNDLAVVQAKAAYDTRRAELGPDDPQTLWSARAYAMALRGLDRGDEAEAVLRDVLARRRRAVPTTGPADADPVGPATANADTAASDLAGILFSQGRAEEALALYRPAWEHLRLTRGADDLSTVATLKGYAMAIASQGRPAEAVPLFGQAWAADRHLMGDDAPGTIAAAVNYAQSLAESDRPAEALPVIADAYDRSRRVLGEDNPHTVFAGMTMAETLLRLGRPADAERVMRPVVDELAGDHPADPTLPTVRWELARTLVAQRRWADAEPLLRQVLAWDKDNDGVDPPSGPSSGLLLNQCLAALGRPAEPTPEPPATTAPVPVPATRPGP